MPPGNPGIGASDDRRMRAAGRHMADRDGRRETTQTAWTAALRGLRGTVVLVLQIVTARKRLDRVAPDAIDQVSRGQGRAANGPRRNRLDLVSRMVVCTVCFTQDGRIAA